MRIQKPRVPHDVESSPPSVSTHHPRPRLVKQSPAVSLPPWEDVLLSSQQWRSTSSVSPYKSAESASTFGCIGMSPEAPSPPVQEPPLVNTQSSTSIIEISDNTRMDKKISLPQEIIEISDDSESDSDMHTRCKRLTTSNVPVKLFYLLTVIPSVCDIDHCKHTKAPAEMLQCHQVALLSAQGIAPDLVSQAIMTCSQCQSVQLTTFCGGGHICRKT